MRSRRGQAGSVTAHGAGGLSRAARCDGASLRDVDLVGATLHNTKLSKADLRGSDLGAIDLTSLDLRGTIVTYTQALVIATALGLDIRDE